MAGVQLVGFTYDRKGTPGRLFVDGELIVFMLERKQAQDQLYPRRLVRVSLEGESQVKTRMSTSDSGRTCITLFMQSSRCP